MKYFSTRSLQETSAAGAIAKGLAPDGGLFVPEQIPCLTLDVSPRDFRSFITHPRLNSKS